MRALTFLATVQCANGAFYQNFHVDPEFSAAKVAAPGVQLDEIAFPIILAWRLHEAGALQDFNPEPMVRQAAAALILNGPSNGAD